ncbi:MAG: SGNH/GDSL hydrolase family protein [Chloroflexi bacterium]|nr:SGNH/GDSL hydrolase family protein [Chloroflexota bacterium]
MDRPEWNTELSSIRPPSSSIQHPASSIQHRVSSILSLFWLLLRHVRLTLLLAGWLLPVVPAHAYDALYAFGDSLTDTGNNPAPPGEYYEGRFSNGPLWVEYLSAKLGLTYDPTHNLAQSGGETSDALNQTGRLTAPVNPAGALYVIWAGGNDFIHHFAQGLNETFWNGQINQAVANLTNAVQVLYGKGARTVLVPNQVDLSRIPLVLNPLVPPVLRTYLSNKVSQFNSALAAALQTVRQAQPDLQLISPDVRAKFDELLANLGAYGFSKAGVDALFDPLLLDKSFNGPGWNYVFWDPIHPTSKSHALVADWFYEAVAMALRPRLEINRDGTSLVLVLSSLQVGRTYLLQRSTDLIGWNNTETFTATAETRQMPITAAVETKAFFRLKSD